MGRALDHNGLFGLSAFRHPAKRFRRDVFVSAAIDKPRRNVLPSLMTCGLVQSRFSHRALSGRHEGGFLRWDISRELFVEFILLDIKILRTGLERYGNSEGRGKCATRKFARKRRCAFALLGSKGGHKNQSLHVPFGRRRVRDDVSAIGMANQNDRLIQARDDPTNVVTVAFDAPKRIGNSDDRISIFFEFGYYAVPTRSVCESTVDKDHSRLDVGTRRAGAATSTAAPRAKRILTVVFMNTPQIVARALRSCTVILVGV